MTTMLQLAAEVRRLSDLIDNGVDALRAAGRDVALAEHTYRMAKAVAYPSTSGTVSARKVQLDADTADLRLVRDLADAERVAAHEALRSRRQQLSACQSVAAAYRADAEMNTYGSQATP